jgi:deoxyribose-phosphate aldolase
MPSGGTFMTPDLTAAQLARLIDHTILRPEALKADVRRVCAEAEQFGFPVIFVPPCYLDEAVHAVRGTLIRVGIPVGFPLGGHSTAVKVAEAPGWSRSGRYDSRHGDQYQPPQVRRFRAGARGHESRP